MVKIINSPKELTDRENIILALIAHGKRNDDIAAFLSISPNTVKAVIKIIMNKLNAKNRTHAVYIMMINGKFKDISPM